MQGHDIDPVLAVAGVGVHNKSDMLEKARHGLELAHVADKLLEVFEPSLRLGTLVVLPHCSVARFIENDLGEFDMRKACQRLAPAGEGVEQVPQGVACLGRQFVRLAQDFGGAIERNAFLACKLMQTLDRAVAYTALRHVDDALECQIVVGRRRDLEIGEGVADFLALIEARTADDPIGYSQGDEAVFKGAHLEGGAHQDRHIVKLLAFALQVFYVIANGAGFLIAVPMRAQGELLAVLTLGPERLAETALVLGNKSRGGTQDLRRRTIVALEPDHLGAGEILLEAQYVVDLGPAPAIDRLVVVADTANVLVSLGQQSQPQILSNIGVLILIDQHVFEPALILLQHIGVHLENMQNLEQQIAEVDGIHHSEPGLIFGVEFRTPAIGESMRFAGRHPGRQRVHGSSNCRSARRAGGRAIASRRYRTPR